MAVAVSIPVAVNRWVCPTARVGAAGVTVTVCAATSSVARARARLTTPHKKNVFTDSFIRVNDPGISGAEQSGRALSWTGEFTRRRCRHGLLDGERCAPAPAVRGGADRGDSGTLARGQSGRVDRGHGRIAARPRHAAP